MRVVSSAYLRLLIFLPTILIPVCASSSPAFYIQKTKIMASGPITSWQIDGETMETETLFWGAPKSLQLVTAAVKLKDACPWKKSYEKSGQGIKNQRHCLSTKVHIVKAMVFPVVMYGCESWIIKKAECQRIDAFELWRRRRLFESPLDCKEIQPVNPKGNRS